MKVHIDHPLSENYRLIQLDSALYLVELPYEARGFTIKLVIKLLLAKFKYRLTFRQIHLLLQTKGCSALNK